MGLEAGSFIDDLVTTNPVGATDPKSEGDDHLRLIKTVVKATFPAMAGAAWRVQAKSGAYTVVANDNMTIINCTAALTLTLTAVATLGNQHLFIAHANGGDVTIDPNAAETINGSATLVVADGSTAIVVCNGTLFRAFVIPTVLTAAALTILDDASVAAMRTTLGLAIGTDVEAFDAGLLSIAGLTTLADRMIYTTASDVYAVATLTAAGRALLDDANAAAQRTTLGLVIGTDIQADLAVPSQAEAEAGTATTERVWTAERVKQAIAALESASTANLNFAVTHTSDTALATRASGGSQIGATISAAAIPTSGVIRVTLLEAEFDETGAAAAEVAFALDIGGTKVWAATDDRAGTTGDATVVINSGVSSRLVGAGVNIPDIGAGGDQTVGPIILSFDIVAGSFPTGSRDVKIFMGDEANSTTGGVTLTGTTVTCRILVEVIDTT